VNVRVVLDTSALVAYARLDGVAVGELIAMVEEDGGASLVGIPAAAFVAAYTTVAPADRLRLVRMATTTEGVSVILPLLAADAVAVAEIEDRMPHRGVAHAIVEARRFGALLATYAGGSVRGELSPDSVLDLD
jgi:hypothetical protein